MQAHKEMKWDAREKRGRSVLWGSLDGLTLLLLKGEEARPYRRQIADLNIYS